MTKRNRKRKPRARHRRPKRHVSKAEIQLSIFLLFVLVAIAAIIGWQPWMYIGEMAVGSVKVIPFYEFFSKIPLLGNGLLWMEDIAHSTAVSIVGVALSLTINTIQVAGGTKVSTMQWVLRVCGGLLEAIVAIHYHAPYDGGIEAIVADFPYLDAYYLNVEGAIMTALSVILFEILFLYGWEYIKGMKKEYQLQQGEYEQPQQA